METGSDKPYENEDAARWREGRRRHETIRRLIDRHGKHLPQSEIIDAAWELDVSRATFYRLIELYREFGTVDVLQPAKLGRRRGARALSSGSSKRKSDRSILNPPARRLRTLWPKRGALTQALHYPIGERLKPG
jgi:hypothetical protein